MRVLSDDDATAWVLRILADGSRLTTKAIEEVGAREGVACPDSTIRFLSRLRHLGRIEGALSVKDKGWVWWLKDAPGAHRGDAPA